MMRCIIRKTAQWIVCFSLCIGLTQFIHAGGIMITPARIEAIVPEDGMLPPIMVQNRSEYPLVLHASIGWGTHDMRGQPIYDSVLPDDTAVYVSPQILQLEPGQRDAFHITIVPSGQSMYPVLFITLVPPDPSTRTMTRLAVPMLLASPHAVPAGLVDMWWIDTKHDTSELVVHAIVENIGEAHLRTDAHLQLTRDGRVMAAVDMPNHLVLPGARRQIETRLDAQTLPEGEYQVVLETQMAMKVDSLIRFAVGPNQDLRLLDGDQSTQLALGGQLP